MTIVFDFDHTIFDMSSMHDAIHEAMEDIGISKADYADAYEKEAQWKMFTVEGVSRRLSKKHKLPVEKIIKTFESVGNLSEVFVYEDVHDHLRTLKEQGHGLYLLTWGDIEWQGRKIHHSGLGGHFDETVTVQDIKAKKLDEWTRSDSPIVVIDDKPAELKMIQQQFPHFHLVRMRRPNAKYSDQETPEGMHEAVDMNAVRQIISGLSA